jgi:hypothetical protein
MREEPAASDEIFRAMQLKQEKLPRVERSKQLLPARLPEIDLVNVWELAQEAIPVVIGYANIQFHNFGKRFLHSRGLFSAPNSLCLQSRFIEQSSQ